MPETGFVVEVQKKYKKSFCRASHLDPKERGRPVRQRSAPGSAATPAPGRRPSRAQAVPRCLEAGGRRFCLQFALRLKPPDGAAARLPLG